jgi:hypothetical protein
MGRYKKKKEQNLTAEHQNKDLKAFQERKKIRPEENC